MYKKKILKIFFSLLIFSIIPSLIYLKFFKKNNTEVIKYNDNQTANNSNIIEDVEYLSKDEKGNEYLIKAEKGEIDFSNSNIIFLKNVYALIKLTGTNEVVITSKFGKYNSENYDTIFSKNVIINYQDNEITGEYLDFSLERNLMVISKNVTYRNINNILNTDVIEINIKTKDTKIFMYENDKKVKIKNKK